MNMCKACYPLGRAQVVRIITRFYRFHTTREYEYKTAFIKATDHWTGFCAVHGVFSAKKLARLLQERNAQELASASKKAQKRNKVEDYDHD